MKENIDQMSNSETANSGKKREWNLKKIQLIKG